MKTLAAIAAALVAVVIALAVTIYATGCRADWPMLLAFAGVVLSWPAVVLYLGTAAFVKFGKQIADFLGNLESAELVSILKLTAGLQRERIRTGETEDKIKDNVVVALHGKQATTGIGSVGTAAGAAEAAAVSGSVGAAVGAAIAEAASAADSVGAEVVRPAAPTAPNELTECRSALAETTMRLHFERSLNVIFGTQLDFLRALRVRPEGITTLEAVASFYTQHRKKAGDAAVPFDVWTGWLKLIRFVADGSAGWVLTNEGLRFLKYLDDQYRIGVPIRAA